MFKYNAVISDLIRPAQTVIIKELYMFYLNVYILSFYKALYDKKGLPMMK